MKKKIISCAAVFMLLSGVAGQAMASFTTGGELVRVIYKVGGTGGEFATDLGSVSAFTAQGAGTGFTNTAVFTPSSVGASSWSDLQVAYFAKIGSGTFWLSGPAGGQTDAGASKSGLATAITSVDGYYGSTRTQFTGVSSSLTSYWRKLDMNSPDAVGSFAGYASNSPTSQNEANLAALGTVGYVDQYLYYYPAATSGVNGSGIQVAQIRTFADGTTQVSSVAPPDTTAPVTTASPVGGTFGASQSVTLTADETATIYYTTNGDAPTESSSAYSGPIFISATTTLKYFAKDQAGNSETINSQTYVIDTTAPVTTAAPAGGTFGASQSVTLTAGETATIYYTTNGDAPTESSSAYSTPISISATTTLKYFAKDQAGNSETIKSQTYVIDTAGPTGTVAISGGATRTKADTVTLDLAAADPLSGVVQMQFSNDGTTWSTAEDYAASKNWSLTPGEGPKTVYVRFKDGMGNWSSPFTVTITVDTTPPVTTAAPAGGTFGASQSVTLTAGETATIYYTTNGDDPTESSSTYSTPIAISATTTLKYFAKDLAGNSETIKSQTYVIDTIGPTGTVAISGGATRTKADTVTLDLAAADPLSGVVQMQFSNDGGTTWSTAEDYAASKSWSLTPGEGPKTVYVRFKDGMGNWSSPFTVTITVDTTLPVTTAAPVGGTFGASQTVTLTADETATIYYTTNGDDPTELSSSTYTIPIVISATTTLKYFAKDLAGNSETIKSQTYVIDTTGPTGTVAISGGATRTKAGTVRLDLAAADPLSGVVQMQFSNNGGTTWSTAEDYAASKSWSLTSGEGLKTVYVRFKDGMGNWSSPFTVTITVDTTLPVTTAAPVGGTFGASQSVTLTADETATIYYTANGDDPTESSSTYSTPIVISATTTLKYFAKDTAGNSETVKTQTYTIDTTPPVTTAAPVGGTFGAPQSVTLTADEPATIYYTTNGDVPTESSSSYSGPISISATTTLKYFAKDLAGNSETVKTSSYTMAYPLTVNRTGLGSGSVAADAGALAWTGNRGTATYDRITAVILTAAPAPGSVFTEWTGACTGASATCSVAMDQARTVTAAFADITLPTGSVSYAGGLYATGSSVTLSLAAADAAGIAAMRFSANGTDWETEQAMAPTWSWNLGTGDGQKQIYVRFKDNAGNWSQSYGYTLTLDTAPPVLNLSTLPDGSYTNNPTLTISGTVSDATAGVQTVTVNGTAVTIQAGAFSQALTLVDGPNVITTIATDNAGNTATDTRTITLDQTAPVLVVSTPADHAITNAMIDVAGTVDEPATVTITVNNGTPEDAPVTNNSFSHPIILAYGLNNIAIKATDRAGNISTVSRAVTYDNQNPVLSVDDPGQDIATNQSSVTLRGTVADLTGITITVRQDGATFTPPVTAGHFEQALSFTTEKTYEVVVTATDQAHNTSTITRKITYDTTVPTLTVNPVTTPTNRSSQTLTGTRGENAAITLSCLTAMVGAVSYPSGTAWSVTLSALSEGSNSIAVRATNLTGSAATSAVVILLDTAAPVTAAAPAEGPYGTPQNVVLTAGETATIYYTTNGDVPTEASSAYSTPIPVSATTTLKYFAKDPAGNSETVKTASYTLAYPLTVNRTGMGSGSVAADAGVIAWTGNTGTSTYDQITAVILTAAPAPGSAFVGWTGACTGASATCSVTMDQARTVTAAFADITLPTGSVSYAGGLYATGSSVTLSLAAADAAGIAAMRFSANGTDWETEQAMAPTWSWNLGTGDGQKQIYVRFKDNAGNWSQSYGYTLTLDTAPPVLNLSTLPDGSYTNNPALTISGTVSDATAGVQTVTVNGTAVTIQAGAFSQALTLVDGPNVITTIATDNAGNAATDTRTITLDQTAPVLVVSAPDDHAITNAMIDVAGTVDEPATVTITVNSGTPEDAPVTNNSFSHPIILAYGLNNIEIKATDRAGNISTVSRAVTYDNQNPVLSVNDPGQDIATHQGSYTLKGSVSDFTGIGLTVQIDGTSYTPSINNGAFEQVLSFTTEKTYEIVVTATDQANNTSTVTRNITYDTTVPTLTVDPVTKPTNQTTYTLTGTMEANAAVAVSCLTATAGTVSYPSGTAWSVTLSGLSEGSNSIDIGATDAAGNASSSHLVVVLDTAAPVTTAAPAGGTFGASQSVTLTANEPAVIYYTLDGSEPTTASSSYSTPIPISATTTLKYFAKDQAGNTEAVQTTLYTLAYPLTVNRTGMGSGSVAADAGALAWTGNRGTATYGRITAVILTAAPAPGSAFAGWTGACTGAPTTCSLAMNQARTVTAAFADIAAPTGSVSYAGGLYATGSTVTLNISASDNASGIAAMRLSTDGTQWGTEQAFATTWNWNLGTGNGPKQIYVQVKDNAGHWSQSYSYALTLDTAPPVLNLSTRPDGSYTNNPTLAISGAVSDATAGVQTLTVNGTAVTIQQKGAFSQALSLVAGPNVITTIATDKAGNATTDTRTITLDQTAPALVVSAPADHAITNAMIDVAGTVDEPAAVTITINSGTPEDAPVTDNSFSHPIILAYGLNNIEIKATDRAGNISTVNRAVTYDNRNPVMSVTDPGQDIATHQGSYTLKGSVADFTGIGLTVQVDGASYTPSINNGAFAQALSFTTEKTYEIVVTATDQANNTSTITRKITYDTTAPALTVDPATVPTNRSSQTLTGTRGENAAIAVSCLTATVGTVSYPSGTAWSVTLSALSEGSNSIEIGATDAAGNASTSHLVVVLDTAAPVTSAAPAGGLYGTPQNVVLTANEPATIYYTLDGSEPTTASSAYSTPLSVSATTTLKYFAKDQAGNTEAVQTASYTLDTAPPVLNLATLPDGSYTNNPSLTISGAVSDATAGVQSLTVNGTAMTIQDGAFSQTLTLVTGPNVITTIATDKAGNTATDTRTITLVRPEKGDVNLSGDVDIADAILALQFLSRRTSAAAVYKEADVNGDGEIGMAEVIYILQKVSGIR